MLSTGVIAKPIDHLVISAKDGTKVFYSLSEKPKITFSATDMIIKVHEAEVIYPLEFLENFTYETSSTTGLSGVQTEKPMFSQKGEWLFFSSLKENDKVFIYSIAGVLIFKKILHHQEDFSFRITDLEKGTYIVKINKLSYKVVRK